MSFYGSDEQVFDIATDISKILKEHGDGVVTVKHEHEKSTVDFHNEYENLSLEYAVEYEALDHSREIRIYGPWNKDNKLSANITLDTSTWEIDGKRKIGLLTKLDGAVKKHIVEKLTRNGYSTGRKFIYKIQL